METRCIREPTPQLDAQLENAAIDYELELVLLRNQVEFYQTEHKSLRGELTALIDENHNLSEQLRLSLASQVARDGTVSGSHPKKPDMVANIKQQFALAVQEKDAAIEMWQSALKEVSCLEEELKTYQGYMKNNLVQTQLDKVKEQYSEAITLLEAKLTWTQAELKKERSLRDDLSAELKELKLEHETSRRLVEAQKDQLQEALKMQAEAERDLRAAREDATAARDSARELEAALARCHETVADLRARHHEACDKVEEAVAALESACAERDRAVLAEASAREENVEAQAALTRLIDDAGARVKEEVERVKSRYNQQIEKVLFDVKTLEDKLADKSAELESPAGRPAAPDLGARLQGLFRELGELQQRNARLSAERDALQLRLDDLGTRHERELQHGEQQRSALEGRLREATALHDQARQLDASQQSVVECFQRRELERGVQERDDLIGRLRAAQARSVETAAELHRHLETQLRVKNKWKRTVKTVTREFEARVKELRLETAALRDENHRLKEEVEALRADTLGYQQTGGV